MQFFCSFEELSGGSLDLTFDVELIPLNQNVTVFDLCEDTLIDEVLNNLLKCVLGANFVLDAEIIHIFSLALKSRLNLVNVEKSLFLNLTGMGSQ